MVRCADEASWRPQNLTYADSPKGTLAAGYQIVNVVRPPEVAIAAGGN
jgi:hypothetical protein